MACKAAHWLLSVVVLLALELLKSKILPVLTRVWYRKAQPTFLVVVAIVRKHVWRARNHTNSAPEANITHFQGELLEMLVRIVCTQLGWL